MTGKSEINTLQSFGPFLHQKVLLCGKLGDNSWLSVSPVFQPGQTFATTPFCGKLSGQHSTSGSTRVSIDEKCVFLHHKIFVSQEVWKQIACFAKAVILLSSWNIAQIWSTFFCLGANMINMWIMEKESISGHVKPRFESNRSSSVFVCVRICQTMDGAQTQTQTHYTHKNKCDTYTYTYAANTQTHQLVMWQNMPNLYWIFRWFSQRLVIQFLLANSLKCHFFDASAVVWQSRSGWIISLK